MLTGLARLAGCHLWFPDETMKVSFLRMKKYTQIYGRPILQAIVSEKYIEYCREADYSFSNSSGICIKILLIP